jgi:hypothetical protein
MTVMTRCFPHVIVLILLASCSSGPPELPYPAYVKADELEDVFLASLPGVRAKQLAGDPMTRRTSNRIDLPADWQGTSGGVPGRSMEIFVLEGELLLADIRLGAGGYAYLPSGSLGFNMKTDDGARILYFVNDADPTAVIRSPIILDTGLLDWQPTPTPGITTKELRRDPGSGATTWLRRIEPGAGIPWEASSALREGYLVRGSYRHSECINGQAVTDIYTAGGYFYRPADAVNGGPASGADAETIWLLRETADGEHRIVGACTVSP